MLSCLPGVKELAERHANLLLYFPVLARKAAIKACCRKWACLRSFLQRFTMEFLTFGQIAASGGLLLSPAAQFAGGGDRQGPSGWQSLLGGLLPFGSHHSPCHPGRRS